MSEGVVVCFTGGPSSGLKEDGEGGANHRNPSADPGPTTGPASLQAMSRVMSRIVSSLETERSGKVRVEVT